MESLRARSLSATLLASAAVFVVALALAGQAHAATPSSMTGESLLSMFSKCDAPPGQPAEPGNPCINNPAPPTVQSTCDENGTSTLQYDVTASGPQKQGPFQIQASAAAGPYSGTFSEKGTVTIGPQTTAAVPVGGGPFPDIITGSFFFNTGPLLTWNASFRIESPTGTVLGKKTLTARVPPNYGVCTTLNNEFRPGGQSGAPVTGYTSLADALMSYQAVIITPDGIAYRDSGTVDSDLREMFLRFSAPGGGFAGDNADVGLLHQGPFASNGTPTPVDKDVCKKDGWFEFGVFTNQGDCVSFFSTQGKNEPGQNVPGV